MSSATEDGKNPNPIVVKPQLSSRPDDLELIRKKQEALVLDDFDFDEDMGKLSIISYRKECVNTTIHV
eukprot:403366408